MSGQQPGPEQQLHRRSTSSLRCPSCPSPNLTPDEARALIREAVRETFLILGVKVDDPIEVQKDFQHLREWRSTTESVKAKGMLAIVGVVVSGLTAALWMGLKELLGGK